MTKNLVLGLILAHLGPFFSQIWLRHSLDVMVSYYHVQYPKKLKIQSWENLVKDRQTDKSDFIGPCQNNSEGLTKGLTKDLINKFSILNGANIFSLGISQNYLLFIPAKTYILVALLGLILGNVMECQKKVLKI